MKPSSKKNKTTFLPFILLLIQPIFMASNLAIARGLKSGELYKNNNCGFSEKFILIIN